MRRRPRRYRRTTHYRRRRRNWIPFMVFVLVLSFFLWALLQFFTLLFANVRTELASAQLDIMQGRAEFRLSNENSDWTPAFSGQNFVEGDALQTLNNTRIGLTFFENHHLYLNENTQLELIKLERTSAGKVTAYWRLNSGELWARIDSEVWQESGDSPDIKIYTPRSVVNVTGTTFNLEVDDTEDNLKLIQGGVQLDILDEDQEDVAQRVTVSVGQQISVDENTKNLAEPASQLSIITPEFLESDWHLKNLEIYDPEGVASTRAKIEARQAPALPETTTEATLDLTDPTIPVNPELEAPVILTPADNAVIPAAQDSIALEGTAPDQAYQVQVNGYTLSKFQPGDRKWTYFAATKFGTLKPGVNTYQVMAIDRQGQRSPVSQITITYEGVAPVVATETPTVEEVIQDFPAPKVTTPSLFADNPEATYQTSADRLTIFGEVPIGTNAVKVNGFQLRKFQPGDTKFQYTAIALGINGNMQEGENIYRIQALGPDGKSSETAVTVHYTPINVTE